MGDKYIKGDLTDLSEKDTEFILFTCGPFFDQKLDINCGLAVVKVRKKQETLYGLFWIERCFGLRAYNIMYKDDRYDCSVYISTLKHKLHYVMKDYHNIVQKHLGYED